MVLKLVDSDDLSQVAIERVQLLHWFARGCGHLTRNEGVRGVQGRFVRRLPLHSCSAAFLCQYSRHLVGVQFMAIDSWRGHLPDLLVDIKSHGCPIELTLVYRFETLF